MYEPRPNEDVTRTGPSNARVVVTARPGEGILVEGTERGDAPILRTVLGTFRGRWSAMLGKWFVQQSRDWPPGSYRFDRAHEIARALTQAGLPARAEVSRHEAPAEIIAAQVERKASRREDRTRSDAARYVDLFEHRTQTPIGEERDDGLGRRMALDLEILHKLKLLMQREGSAEPALQAELAALRTRIQADHAAAKEEVRRRGYRRLELSDLHPGQAVVVGEGRGVVAARYQPAKLRVDLPNRHPRTYHVDDVAIVFRDGTSGPYGWWRPEGMASPAFRPTSAPPVAPDVWTAPQKGPLAGATLEQLDNAARAAIAEGEGAIARLAHAGYDVKNSVARGQFINLASNYRAGTRDPSLPIGQVPTLVWQLRDVAERLSRLAFKAEIGQVAVRPSFATVVPLPEAPAGQLRLFNPAPDGVIAGCLRATPCLAQRRSNPSFYGGVRKIPDAEQIPGTARWRMMAAPDAVDSEFYREAIATQQAMVDARNAVADALAVGVVEFKKPGDNRYAVLTPDASDPGKWRYSEFDRHGPFSHQSFVTKEEAAWDLADEGYVEPAPGGLDRLAAEPTWTQGAMDAVVNQIVNSLGHKGSEAAQRAVALFWRDGQRSLATFQRLTAPDVIEALRRGEVPRALTAPIQQNPSGYPATGSICVGKGGKPVPCGTKDAVPSGEILYRPRLRDGSRPRIYLPAGSRYGKAGADLYEARGAVAADRLPTWTRPAHGRHMADLLDGVEGAPTFVYVTSASGFPERQPGRYRIVPVERLIPSHKPDTFEPHPAYPPGVQERQYHRDTSEQLKVIRNAQGFRPDLVVTDNPDAANGPPVILPSGIVLGGNSRVMSMQRVYADPALTDKAKDLGKTLRARAQTFGFLPGDVGEVTHPVLVRIVDPPDQSAEGLRDLVRRYNEALTQGLDPTAAQVAAGGRITDAVVEAIASQIGPDETLNDFLTSNRSKELLSELQRSGFIDPRTWSVFIDSRKGLLNEDGRRAVVRAILGRVLPDPGLLEVLGPELRDSLANGMPAVLAAAAIGGEALQPGSALPRSRSPVRRHAVEGGGGQAGSRQLAALPCADGAPFWTAAPAHRGDARGPQRAVERAAIPGGGEAVLADGAAVSGRSAGPIRRRTGRAGHRQVGMVHRSQVGRMHRRGGVTWQT